MTEPVQIRLVLVANFNIYKTDGWMTYNFTSLSTVFQSYQDDERLIMEGCVQWNLFRVEKISP